MNTDDYSTNSIRTTAFFTGHRILPAQDIPLIRNLVSQCVSEAYTAGYRRFYCGCALGFDTIAAFETIKLRNVHPDISLLLAIPCADQSARWKADDKEIYRRLLDIADDKVVLSQTYYPGAMLSRNRYMADRSSLCICYMTQLRGGTASTVRYAIVHDRIRIINLAMNVSGYCTSNLREDTWSFTFTSHSAGENAATVPLSLIRGRKLTMKNISA